MLAGINSVNVKDKLKRLFVFFAEIISADCGIYYYIKSLNVQFE